MKKVTFAFWLMLAFFNVTGVLGRHEGHTPAPAKPAATLAAPKPKPTPAARPGAERGGHPAPPAVSNPLPLPVAKPRHEDHAAHAATPSATPADAHDLKSSSDEDTYW